MKNITFTLLILFLCTVFVGCTCGDDDDNDSDSPDVVDDDAEDDVNDDVDDDADDDADDDVNDDVDDDDTTPICDWGSYDPLILSGKTALGDYDPASALTDFEAAAQICPEIGDAQMGVLLAEFQALVQAATTALSGYSDFPFIDWEAFAQTIATDLLPLNEGLISAADTMVANFPDVRFYLQSYPVLVDGETVALDLGGEWDYADAINLSGLAYLIDAVEHFLLAFYLDADWSQIQTAPYLYDPMEVIHWYTDKLLVMLNDPIYPDFLTFTAEGPQHFADFAISLGFAAIDGKIGFDAVLLENDPQGDDITGYVDANGNGQWDEGERYFLPFYGPLAIELNDLLLGSLILMENLGPAMLDRGPEDLHPLWPDWLPLGDLNYLLTALQVWLPGLSLPDIPIPVGRWFYIPPDDGLRTVAIALIQLLNDFSAP